MPIFPAKPFHDVGEYYAAYGEEVATAFASLDRNELRKAAECLELAVARRAAIFVCGNGGSAAISNHFVCDHVKGARDSSAFHACVTSLSTNMEIVTAIANDIGYEAIFEFQLSAFAAPGDVLVAISSSGGSPNILNALRWARENKLATIAMTGFGGGAGREQADIKLHIEAHNYGVVEDVHQSLMHILAQYLRHKHLHDPSQIGRAKF